jgi:hypothetical protein
MGLVYGRKGKQNLVGYVDSDFARDVRTSLAKSESEFILENQQQGLCSCSTGEQFPGEAKSDNQRPRPRLKLNFIAASHALKEGVWLGSFWKSWVSQCPG